MAEAQTLGRVQTQVAVDILGVLVESQFGRCPPGGVPAYRAEQVFAT